MVLRSRLFFSSLFIQNRKYGIKIGEKYPLGSIFFHPKVQFFMKKLTVVDYEKLFAIRKLGKPLSVPKYTFMTDAELEKEREHIKKRARILLQMPPLVDVTEDKIKILANDSSLDGHEEHHSKIIFTDISNDLKAHERAIVVREPNGLLRTANKSERKRMNQIFFPTHGRQLKTPKMFKSPYIEEILERGDFEFILNRACVQFNPEDEDYHDIITKTFNYINSKREFDKLMNTRHFGPFVLYLAVKDNIDNLLQVFLERIQLMEAAYLVSIHQIVHTETPWSLDVATEKIEGTGELFSFEEACDLVKDFVSHKSKHEYLQYTYKAALKNLQEVQELKNPGNPNIHDL